MAYHAMLEHTQKGTLDVTAWLLWFLAGFSRAVQGGFLGLRLVSLSAGC